MGLATLFPFGQCTWWASQEYYNLTGHMVGLWGNASSWVTGANNASGWHVSSTPPVGIPSIVVLQPGVQGADPTYGHVGIVTGVNSNNTVTVSNMNWHAGPVIDTVNGVPITQSTISVGNGVSFLYYGDASTTPTSGTIPTTTLSATGLPSLSDIGNAINNQLQSFINPQVTTFEGGVTKFVGIAGLAIVAILMVYMGVVLVTGHDVVNASEYASKEIASHKEILEALAM